MALISRSNTSPYRMYLGMEIAMTFAISLAYTTQVVYWVTGAGLNPLQLLLLGTVMEGVYFLVQLPTGIFADLTSRRLSIIAGVFLIAAGFVLQGASTAFTFLMVSQAVISLGAALMSGAQESWIADETEEEEMAAVYLRATQLGFIGKIAGSLLSGVVALLALNMPLLVGGGLIILVGAVLALKMPETHHRRLGDSGSVGTVLRKAAGEFGRQIRSSRAGMRAVPGLFLLLGMTFFFGFWTESFDRLWGAFLLEDIAFPTAFGLRPPLWFSIISCVVALIGMVTTGLARRRIKHLGSRAIVGMLMLLTSVAGIGVLAMAASTVFWFAIVFYLVVSAARPLYVPLVNGWLVTRVDPEVRATALSARDMFDAGGQIVSGPAIGSLGKVLSIRAALVAGVAVLVPAIACLLGATRRTTVVSESHEEVETPPVEVDPVS